MKNVLLFLGILLLTSCTSLYQFTIEVQKPAPITLPPDVLVMGVVNNAAAQPGDKGITRTYRGNALDRTPLNLDSMANITAIALATRLQESSFFERIEVSPHSLRTDDNWMGSEPLPQSFKTTAFESGGFQGILSIDRLLFKLDQEVRNDLYINIRASCIATCTVHIYSRESPLTTFSVADSLTFSTQAMGDTVAIFNYIPTSVIKDMAYDIGEQLSHRIIPSWSEEDRFLYAGSQARLAEALGFARKGHWSRAISLWLDEYERASAVETRAKMAANLAVAHEMLDQFQTALQWAATAQRHFAESGRAASAKARTAAHMAELNRRIKDNYLLDLQWGTPSEQ